MARKKVVKKAAKKATRKPARKTATRKPAAKKKKANNEMLLVASKTKEAIKAHNCNVSGDAMDGLNNWIHWLVGQAAQRAAANGRKTVRAHDFMAIQ